MRKQIIAPLIFTGILLIFLNCSKKISEKDITGSWKNFKAGQGEEINFSPKNEDYSFSVFLYERLVQSGTWLLKGDKLEIKFQSGEINRYKKVTVENNLLSLYNENGDVEQYKKMIPGEKPDKDTIIQGIKELLEEIKGNISDTATESEQIKMTWHVNREKSEEINGFGIKYNLKAGSGFEKANALAGDIINVLQIRNFTSDSNNVTEIMSGMKKDNIVCQILVSGSDEDGSVLVQVNLGALTDD